MKSHWAVYEEKRILYIDLSNLRGDVHKFDAELTETVATIGQKIYEQPLNSVLVLVDLRNTDLTQKANALLTERIKDTKKYVLRTAVVGLTGIRKVFLDYFAMLASSETGSFEEHESAMEWLVQTK
jgi:predicted transcriptional regulator